MSNRIVFDLAIVQAAVTSISHATILTGLYPYHQLQPEQTEFYDLATDPGEARNVARRGAGDVTTRLLWATSIRPPKLRPRRGPGRLLLTKAREPNALRGYNA